ncbi:hypothetical protein E6W36_04035 [Hankyongella ginsenosidimutans]|uniref:Uncharacterized protein n=1 Tax=Hankyongella ginsenosidimutans TaxID=1763828 RepID=A0A4D7C1X9_9SPHN|nr:hypothetical protein [Hankyongella ginsenosidimutans]QCI79051.1 hypothetical protein E6W36_04035 [Hankyongella ginsenosidimutans]
MRALIHADPRAGQVPHLYLDRNAHRLDWVPAEGEPVRLAFAGSHSKGPSSGTAATSSRRP